MIAVIQTVPSRLERAKRQAAALSIPCEIYVDEMMEGTFPAFVQTLKKFPQGDQYRLHMQDDLLFADNLASYLSTIEADATRGGMDYLSLYFVRKGIHKAPPGERYMTATLRVYVEAQCFLMSPLLSQKILEMSERFPSYYPDDVVLCRVMRRCKMKANYHFPSLVQHDIGIPSTLGHKTTKLQTSRIFQKDFVTNLK